MADFTAQVDANRRIAPRTYRLELSVPSMLSIAPRPGQFFMIKTSPGFDPLLRRPFSLLSAGRPGSADANRISFLFRTIGRGTCLMAQWVQGQSVEMLGPLGRGYTLPADPGPIALIAGGLGIASLNFLAEHVLREENRDVRVYIGGKSGQDILMKSELEGMGARVLVSTEDGSMGRKGLVTEWLDREGADLAKGGCTAMFACGPLDMLARIAAMANALSLPCQVSLETRMACGLGACLGCAVRTRHGNYHMVCKHGPTFDVSEIDWEATKRLL